MKVTFLGVGSAFSRKNANSNVLIECGEIKLLIDCSKTCPPALEHYGLTIKDITHIFITHFHGDHTSGLEEMAFMTRLLYQQKITLVSTASVLNRLWDTSLRGPLEYLELTPGSTELQTLDDYFIRHPVPPRQWQSLRENPGLRIHLHPTNHIKGMESYGLEVEEYPGGKEKRFFFSSDTKFDRKLIDHAHQSCSLIFHDCQLFETGDNNRLGVHASYQQLKQLPPDIRQKMWLYHYGDTPLPDAQKDGFAGFVKSFQSFTF